ncbi:hypothetical protein A3Q56_03019 [Intoshia linei]|uniref:Phospholipid/glycerol acyltransferase domain-containing protein n=1 Tax=Intoshia linei TaxID=1819745 RepID=A0A177B6H5_9BILA|nr:hypothetical protein A3Q56_03019 [Intoshia linei]
MYSIFIYLLLFPFVVIYFTMIFLAGIDNSLLLNQYYIKFLLYLFKWSTKITKNHEKDSNIDINLRQSDVESEMDITDYTFTSKDLATPVIDRDTHTQQDQIFFSRNCTMSDSYGLCHPIDVMRYVKHAMESVVEDDVTKRFTSAELSNWNLLTRTNAKHQFISYKLTCLWILGCFTRYFIFLPFRLFVLVFAISVIVCAHFICGLFRNRKNYHGHLHNLTIQVYRLTARALSAVIKFHNPEHKAKPGGICVANHTSPIDIILLGCDNVYGMDEISVLDVICAFRKIYIEWFDEITSLLSISTINNLRNIINMFTENCDLDDNIFNNWVFTALINEKFIEFKVEESNMQEKLALGLEIAFEKLPVHNILFRMLCKIPLTEASVERAFSKHHQFHNYLRANLSTEN